MAQIPSTSAAASSSSQVEQPRAAARRFPRRLWIPFTLLLLAGTGVLAVALLPGESLAIGDRRLIIFIIAVVASLATIAWFMFGSGASLRSRLAIGGLLACGLLLAILSVRQVEFSGDMTPTFAFRWSPDRMALLEEHRTRSDTAASELPELRDISVGQYDVLEYRGPGRSGVEPGPALARDWQQSPPKLLWKQPVGGGYTSFLAIGPALVTIEQRRNKEAVVVYEADSGNELWVREYPALFSETLGGDGPRATPNYHDGSLYVQGATGWLTAYTLDGTEQWRVNILKENGSKNIEWGMSGSPLILDDTVLVNPGDQQGNPESRAIVAYGLADGKRRWAAGNRRASYASLMLATLGGVRQVLLFDSVGLAGCDPTDGHQLWSFDWKSGFNINAAQPVVLDDDRVVITSDAGTALLKIQHDGDDWTVEEQWRSRRLKGNYASPIAFEGYLYGLDGSILVCLDLNDGKLKWKDRDGQYGHGQLLRRDDLLVILGEAGELALVEATPKGFHEFGRIQAIEGKTWNVPILVGNRAYVRNHLEMAAYELPTLENAVDESPATP